MLHWQCFSLFWSHVDFHLWDPHYLIRLISKICYLPSRFACRGIIFLIECCIVVNLKLPFIIFCKQCKWVVFFVCIFHTWYSLQILRVKSDINYLPRCTFHLLDFIHKKYANSLTNTSLKKFWEGFFRFMINLQTIKKDFEKVKMLRQ